MEETIEPRPLCFFIQVGKRGEKYPHPLRVWTSPHRRDSSLSLQSSPPDLRPTPQPNRHLPPFVYGRPKSSSFLSLALPFLSFPLIDRSTAARVCCRAFPTHDCGPYDDTRRQTPAAARPACVGQRKARPGPLAQPHADINRVDHSHAHAHSIHHPTGERKQEAAAWAPAAGRPTAWGAGRCRSARQASQPWAAPPPSPPMAPPRRWAPTTHRRWRHAFSSRTPSR